MALRFGGCEIFCLTSDISFRLASSFSLSCCNSRTFCSCISSKACPVNSISASTASSSYKIGRRKSTKYSQSLCMNKTSRELLDCSQSTIFPCDRRCRCGSLNASETGESTINPTTPTHGHFGLSPVSLASRDQDDGPVELNDRHLRSHGKIGDCEQSVNSL